MIERIALIVLVLSFLGLAAIVLRKIPKLSTMPEAGSGRRLVFDFLNIALSQAKALKDKTPLKSFSTETFLQKTLSKARVLILKTESKITFWLQTLRERSLKKKIGESDNYWKDVARAGEETPSASIQAPEESAVKAARKRRKPGQV